MCAVRLAAAAAAALWQGHFIRHMQLINAKQMIKTDAEKGLGGGSVRKRERGEMELQLDFGKNGCTLGMANERVLNICRWLSWLLNSAMWLRFYPAQQQQQQQQTTITATIPTTATTLSNKQFKNHKVKGQSRQLVTAGSANGQL